MEWSVGLLFAALLAVHEEENGGQGLGEPLLRDDQNSQNQLPVQESVISLSGQYSCSVINYKGEKLCRFHSVDVVSSKH